MDTYPNCYPAARIKLAARKTRLLTELTEAREELQYWRRQAAIRTHPQAITEAKARVLAWKSTVATRVEKLNQA